ncbi:hypothetical protein MLD38_011005 [Melastoma candidum]|uniref:Uncharacterized protein n=1 Tax=Melastoma candidum TaxID=119954 RepID=A0ACB9RA05_9MYRT|nr:hypothetical protein MLD38_011005 [Melastoma candidum]
MGSRTVKHIVDVSRLQISQFPHDDVGPMAHPVRPHSYINMNIFYAVMVYEKGVEVVSMYKTLLGPQGFRNRMDLYFERHDGQAVGVPLIRVSSHFNAEANTFSLKLSQEVPSTPGQPVKEYMFIPIVIGLLDSIRKDLPLPSI